MIKFLEKEEYVNFLLKLLVYIMYKIKGINFHPIGDVISTVFNIYHFFTFCKILLFGIFINYFVK